MKNANVTGTLLSSISACALVSLLCAPSAVAQVSAEASFTMPVRVQASVAMTGCANAPGPQITMDGTMAMGGVNVQLLFENNLIGTHSYITNSVEEVAVQSGATFQIPKQPVLGGVGGNPFIWVQMMDDADNPLSPQIFLGRCVQGPFNVVAPIAPEVTVSATFSASDCSNNPGPYISMNGALSFSHGVKARFLFANSDNLAPHQTYRTADVALVPSGSAIQFVKQPVLGGVGGNPWILCQFQQGDGTHIGSAALLGRCVQMSQ